MCDLDRDGDLDILITHLEAPVTLLGNISGEGERLLIELEGVESNRKGIGSKITLTTSHGMQTRYLGANSGFMSADEPVAHFAVPEGVDQASLEFSGPMVACRPPASPNGTPITSSRKHLICRPV